MVTHFLGLCYWELLEQREDSQEKNLGEKLSYFGHVESEGLVGHLESDVQLVAGIERQGRK